MSAPVNLHESLPLWEYATPGPLRERLSGLTLAGVKTTTFDTVDPAEQPPVVGSQWVMVGSDSARLAVLEVIEVIEMRLGDVPWELAEAEGESFTDLADWRHAHNRFWASVGESVTDDTMVRCERFVVVETLPGATGPRFPVVEVLVGHDDIEWVSAELAELDTIGIEEVAAGSTTNGTPIAEGMVMLRAGFVSDHLAAAAEQELSQPHWRRFEVLIGDDWLDAWRDGFEPVSVGRFLIWPDWLDLGGRDQAVGEESGAVEVIRFDPGRAWGTGGHQSTQLALALLQSLPPSVIHDAMVLDAGCGSGLLSIAAALMGAAHVDAVDIDIAAPPIVDRNATLNAVEHVITASTEPVASLGQRSAGAYTVVLANILAPVLVELAPHLRAALKPDGWLILAGLIDTQIDMIEAAFNGGPAPLKVRQIVEDGVWRGMLLTHEFPSQ